MNGSAVRGLIAIALFWVGTLAIAATPPATIPIRLTWDTIKPDAVLLQLDGGPRELDYDESTKSFHGQIDTPDDLNRKQTILLRYNNNSYPLIVNVRRSLSSVQFTIALDPWPSCADLYVRRVEHPADNMEEALRLMLTAARLLKIPAQNDCTGNRKNRAITAQFMRNSNLATRSNGLFDINPVARQQYVQLFTTGTTQYAQALTVTNSYAADANAAFVKGVYGDVKLAIADNQPSEALSLTETISDAVSADPELAKSFEKEGINKKRLDDDIGYLRNLAEQRAAPDH